VTICFGDPHSAQVLVKFDSHIVEFRQASFFLDEDAIVSRPLHSIGRQTPACSCYLAAATGNKTLAPLLFLSFLCLYVLRFF
jgi:hypothetical protein